MVEITNEINHKVYTGGNLNGKIVLRNPSNNIKEIYLKLKGYFNIKINNNDDTLIRTIKLIDDTITLYTINNSSTSLNSHSIGLPYTLSIPQNLPPSYNEHNKSFKVDINYSIHIYIDKGLFNSSKRFNFNLNIHKPSLDIRLNSQLPSWNGNFDSFKSNTLTKSKAINSLEVLLPKVTYLPVLIPFPIKVIINISNDFINSSLIDFKLIRTVLTRTRNWHQFKSSQYEVLNSIGGFGLNADFHSSQSIIRDNIGNNLIKFSTAGFLNVTTPSFSYDEIFQIKHHFNVTLQSSELKKVLQLDIPITLIDNNQPIIINNSIDNNLNVPPPPYTEF